MTTPKDEELNRDTANVDGGLAPAAAADWLEMQEALAWQPEAVSTRLRDGIPPREIFRDLRRQGELHLGESLNPRARLPATGFGDDPSGGNGEKSEKRLRRFESLGLRVVPLTDSAYPRALAELVDAPPVLLVRGRVGSLAGPGIAIVGARAATRGARETARRLARELAAAGLVIVSGLARGIDAEAHRGALEANGRTVGVLACGPDQIYPPEHRALAQEMTESGAVVSEMPLGVPPRPAHFPLRNRIISGLCLGIIVVEARRRSGSLITVRHALGQGREVFVVPGSIDGPFAEGTNLLLRDGARPICSAADVLEDLGFQASLDRVVSKPDLSVAPAETRTSSSKPPVASLAAWILSALKQGPITRDALADLAGREGSGPSEEGPRESAVPKLAAALVELELIGRINLDRDGRIHLRWRS